MRVVLLVCLLICSVGSGGLSMEGTDIKPLDQRVWDSYAYWTDDYLNREGASWAGKSPMTGQMVAQAAKQAYEKYGKLVPIDVMLAQSQIENKFGTDASGRKNYKTNPFNVGEYDEGTKMVFPDTQSGVNAYFDLMARRYLSKNNREGLLENFVNDEGQRYASDPDYEKKLQAQVNFIRQRAKVKYNKMQEKK